MNVYECMNSLTRTPIYISITETRHLNHLFVFLYAAVFCFVAAGSGLAVRAHGARFATRASLLSPALAHRPGHVSGGFVGSARCERGGRVEGLGLWHWHWHWLRRRYWCRCRYPALHAASGSLSWRSHASLASNRSHFAQDGSCCSFRHRCRQHCCWF